MLELNLLLIFMIIGALIAIENHNLLSSVIAVGAVGFGLSIVFLLLGAPDLAITQLVVEILALIILIRATLAKSVPETYKGRELHAYAITIIFILALLGVSYYAFQSLPQFGVPIMKVARTYLSEGLAKTGATNLVAAVILDFRAYDTLGEATVLFTAIIGAITVLRLKGRKKVTEEDPE
ncbi:hydrogen gas-evolving membrane-bound hydrogenase subunit E [Candidatus Margulisiibacteriota bacterium]